MTDLKVVGNIFWITVENLRVFADTIAICRTRDEYYMGDFYVASSECGDNYIADLLASMWEAGEVTQEYSPMRTEYRVNVSEQDEHDILAEILVGIDYDDVPEIYNIQEELRDFLPTCRYKSTYEAVKKYINDIQEWLE